MVAQVVVDQQLDNGVIALVRRDDDVVLGHVRELRAGVWHGAVAGEPAHIFRNRAAAERFVLATAAGPWQRALQRAIAEGIDPLAVAGMDGTFFCESSREPGKGYLTTATTCGCPAGLKGQPCKHIASVRAISGLPVAPDTDPEPPAPAADRAVAPDGFFVDTCRECSGLGKTWFEWGHDACSRTCAACGGTGRIPAAA